MRVNRIQEEAAVWAVRAARWDPWTAEEEAQLRTWLAADVRHQGAYARAAATRINIERIASLAGGRVPERRLTLRRASVALAAGLGIVAVVIAFGWFAHARPDRYASAVGELRKVALEDGSSIFLNTDTQALARFGSHAREIELPRGEALFEVARDPSRPFVVHAGEMTVQAIGTAFVVRHERDAVDVVVTEGVVEVGWAGERPRRMVANQQARATAGGSIAIRTLQRRETERQLAWQAGRVEFDGQPLSQAVAQMNRHSRRQVIVSDAALARRPVVGVFRSVDIEAFARIAAQALDARVIEDGAWIRMEPRTR